MKQIIIPVEGMRCPMCEGHVNQSVLKIEGVVKCTADRVSKTATVIANDAVKVEDLVSAITKDGYNVTGEASVSEVKKTLFGYKAL